MNMMASAAHLFVNLGHMADTDDASLAVPEPSVISMGQQSAVPVRQTPSPLIPAARCVNHAQVQQPQQTANSASSFATFRHLILCQLQLNTQLCHPWSHLSSIPWSPQWALLTTPQSAIIISVILYWSRSKSNFCQRSKECEPDQIVVQVDDVDRTQRFQFHPLPPNK